ncbi:uncharacterized protein LOC102808060 [Saccoglossus kowalevskii]
MTIPPGEKQSGIIKAELTTIFSHCRLYTDLNDSSNTRFKMRKSTLFAILVIVCILGNLATIQGVHLNRGRKGKSLDQTENVVYADIDSRDTDAAKDNMIHDDK